MEDVSLLREKTVIPKMICSDCGCKINENGICPNCGLVEQEEEYRSEDIYPYDEDKETHYGDPVSICVSDISLMTKINLFEINNPDLRRAVQWDEKYGWEIEKYEIVIHEIKKICKNLGLPYVIRDYSIYFFKKYVAPLTLSGKKLEILSLAVVYLVIRMRNLPYTFFDFVEAGYSTENVLGYFRFLVNKLELKPYLKNQDITLFLQKFLNSLIKDEPETFRIKYELLVLLRNIFYGLSTKSRIYTDVAANMVVFGALSYLSLKRLEHPTINVENVTQKVIAKACQTSEVTLREYIRKIKVMINKYDECLV